MKRLIVLMCVLSVVSFANALTIRYQGSGDWFDVDTSDGIGWQGGVLPGAADTVRFNWGNNTVTLDGAAPDVTSFQMGVDESGGLVVNNGGSLTATGNSKVGNNNVCTGFLTINTGGTVTNNGWLMVAGNSSVTGILDISGTLNANGHLWSATGAGSTATINIWDGGVVNVSGMLGLGTSNATSDGGGIATLSVNDGGLLALAQIHGGITDPLSTGSSIRAGSMLHINGTGMVTKTGNFVGVMDAYAAAGLISGNGIAGNVVAAYDDVADLTTVIAVPEPATMALLGLGALGLLRKRK